jgi:CshA-type fibril repeat protein
VENGKISFVPDSDFSGTATVPVRYQVRDGDRQVASAILTLAVAGVPVAVNDATAADINQNQTSNVLANDVSNTGTPLAGNLVKLVGPSSTLVDSVTTADGVYSLNTATGVITFDPIDNFTGEATPVTYQVTDSMGQTARATYTPTSKAIPPKVSIAPANEPQSRNVLQDQAGLRPETLRLLDPTGAPLSSSAIQMPEQGTFELRGAEITFTPNTDAILAKLLAEPSGQKRFYKTDNDGNQVLDRRGKPILIRVEADITPIGFQAQDSNGITVQNVYEPVVTFKAPAAAPDFSRGPANEPQSQRVLSNDGFGANSGTKLLPETLELVAPSTGEVVGENKVRIPDEGTFSFDGESVLFQPDMDALVDMLKDDLVAHKGDYTKAKLREVWENGVYLGLEAEVTTITYTVLDEFGFLVTTTYTPRVFFPKPAATPDYSKGAINEPQRTDVIANDSPSVGIAFEADYLKIWNPANGGSWGSAPVATDEGVYTVEAAEGVTLQTAGFGGAQKIVLATNISAAGQNSVLVFTPRLNWTGTATPVRYQLRDVFGQTVESTKTPTIEGETVVSAINKLARTGGQPLQFVMAIAAGLFTIGMSLKISSSRRRNPHSF